MTYTEIIDNIQTRIENLIAERFSGTYMNITIEPSDYNPDIDDEITVTITVTDQNDDPISNWNVPLQINGTAVATTLTTDTNGQVTYTHSCDDWGICRFSVKSFVAFINVEGWRIAQNDSNYFLKYNDKLVFARVSVAINVNWSTTVGHLGAEWLKDPNHPEINLRPRMPISASQAPNKTIMLANNDYRVGYFTHTGTGTGGLYASFTQMVGST